MDEVQKGKRKRIVTILKVVALALSKTNSPNTGYVLEKSNFSNDIACLWQFDNIKSNRSGQDLCDIMCVCWPARTHIDYVKLFKRFE